MGSVPKRHCHRDEKTLDANKDYISNLPDCLLSLIVSKLPTKYAVATTILSTRWKHLFALIPYLELELDDSLILHRENQGKVTLADIFAKFMDRMFNVILKEVPYIVEFTLKCREEYGDEKVLDWVCAALSRSVPLVDIDVYLNDPVRFFYLISDWSCLIFLALRSKMPLHVPESFSLPNLEYLVLDKIEIWNEDGKILHLLSGCPMLKSLTLRGLMFYNLDFEDAHIQISVPKLNNLTIENCWYNGSVTYFRFVLDTPALENLYYQDYMPDELVFNNVNSIKSAHLSVKDFEGLDETHQTVEKYNKDVAALVRACSNAHFLFLSKYTVSALQESNEQVPTFCSLTSLQLGGFNTNGWKLLPHLLANASKLQLFSISKGFHEDTGSFEIFMSQLSKIATFLLSNLKKVEIFKLEGKADGLGLIAYFLAVGKVLDNLEITMNTSSEIYDFVRQRLVKMKKLSDTCRITTFKIMYEPFLRRSADPL